MKTKNSYLKLIEVKFKMDNHVMARTDTQRKRELAVADIMEENGRKDLAEWARAGRFTLYLDQLRRSRNSIWACAQSIMGLNPQSAPIQKAVEKPTTTAQRKIGANRGKTRLWLEGKLLSDSNWKRGDSFDVIWMDGVLRYIKNPNGSRKVAGTEARPIIDTNTDKLATTLHATTGEKVSITVTPNSITIQK